MSTSNTQPELRHLPITSLLLSSTTAQLERRKHFDDAALDDLAAAMQSIPARPIVAAISISSPADGQITCHAVSTGSLDSYLIEQDTNIIACSQRQLQSLCDWATAQLKKAAS